MKKKKKNNEDLQMLLMYIFQIIGILILSIVLKYTNTIGLTIFSLLIISVVGIAVFGITYVVGRRKKKRTRIFGIFVGYLNLIFLFSIVYFIIYINSPILFEISRIKPYDKITLEQVVSEELNNVNSDVYCFNLLKINPDKVLQAKKEKEYVNIDSLTSLKFLLITSPKSYSKIFLTIKDFDKEYRYSNLELLNPLTPLLGKLYSADNLKEVNYALNIILEHLTIKQNEIKSKYVKLYKDNNYVCYLDFLFYSASNMSLLKFDKVSSEKTFINFINFFQAILGIFYLGYGIVIIWPEKEQ